MKMIKFTVCLTFIYYFSIICHGKSPNKIINGMMWNIMEAPFMASIQHRKVHICAGAIISRRHILTSASCATIDLHVYPGNLQCRTGTADLFSATGSLHNVNRIIFHPKYNPEKNWVHDLAVLSLDSLLEYSETCMRIFLPSKRLFVNSLILNLGWGGTKYLTAVRMRVGSYERCEEVYSGFTFKYEKQGCFHSINQNVFTTMGDGGNPLIYRGTVSAIVSVFIPQKSDFVIVTRTWSYVGWITKMVQMF